MDLPISAGSAAPPRRFATLDAMRGVAAILVMLYHMANWFPESAPLPMAGGYLAVDLFFALSGFVLALSYGDRLGRDLSVGQFMRLRLARIYPMAGLAALFCVVVHGAHPAMVLLIPDMRSGQGLFPANPPFWSLLFELLVNFAWAALVLRLGNRMLAAVVLGCGALLIPAVLTDGASAIGAFWSSAAMGLVRTMFSFGIGIALCRLHQAQAPRRRQSRLGWLLVAALIAALAYAPAARAWWDLACILFILPALVWAGTRVELPQRRLSGLLGDLSYPLYCIHVPVLVLVVGGPLAIAGSSLGLVLLAWALDRWFDRPVRAWLFSQISQSRRQPQPA